MINSQYVVQPLSFQHPLWIQCYHATKKIFFVRCYTPSIYIKKDPLKYKNTHTQKDPPKYKKKKNLPQQLTCVKAQPSGLTNVCRMVSFSCLSGFLQVV